MVEKIEVDQIHGSHTYANGDVYVGEWKDSKRNGHGTLTSTVDRYVYVGEWKDNKKNGNGTFTYADGSVYILGNSKMTIFVAMVLLHILMVIYILGNSKMIMCMVMVPLNLLMAV